MRTGLVLPRGRRPRAGSARRLACMGALVLAACGMACDDSFAPFAPNAQRLSVWGYLEVARDTQWIRIGALRPTVLASGDSLPVQATLEDLAGGGIIQLRQATVRADVISPMDSTGTTVHNFWTTAPVRAGASFRFRAKGDVGSPVEAVIRVPPDYRMEVLVGQSWNRSRSDSLVLIGLRYVAFVKVTTLAVDSCGNFSEEQTFAPVSDSLHEAHSTPVTRPAPGRRARCSASFVVGRTLSVVGAGSTWPQGSNFAAMGDVGPGNITNGVGFLGGTLSKTVPYENCDYVSSTGNNAHCRLRYDSTTATLKGRIWDPLCKEVVARALVTLQELDPRPPEVAKIRSIYTDIDGRYWIGGLEPGMHYAMTVQRDERPPIWGPGPPYEFQYYHATVAFTPGQQATQDIDLLGRLPALCQLGRN